MFRIITKTASSKGLIIKPGKIYKETPVKFMRRNKQKIGILLGISFSYSGQGNFNVSKVFP